MLKNIFKKKEKEKEESIKVSEAYNELYSCVDSMIVDLCDYIESDNKDYLEDFNQHKHLVSELDKKISDMLNKLEEI